MQVFIHSLRIFSLFAFKKYAAITSITGRPNEQALYLI